LPDADFEDSVFYTDGNASGRPDARDNQRAEKRSLNLK
jgi:hypothetical protein